jgi:transcriptional regulator with XRE-family HTH domain
MSELQYHVASRVHEEREGAGITKQELSEFTGISRRTLVHIENAQHMPSLYHLSLIASVLAVPVSTFLEGAPQHE